MKYKKASLPSSKAKMPFYTSQLSVRHFSKVILRTVIPENTLRGRKGRKGARGAWAAKSTTVQRLPRPAAHREVPFPVAQGLFWAPNYLVHIWSSCTLSGLRHVILLQTLFSFPGLSHKRLWRQDKVGSVCVSIPVCVSVCVCVSHCDCPIDS